MVTFDESAEQKAPSERNARSEKFMQMKKKFGSLRFDLSNNEKFDTKTLPDDVRRVYKKLAEQKGEEYALIWVFSMRTAIELHRGWHMPLLTSKILQQIKEKFKMRMTWNLGMVKLIFRVEDGAFELQRKIPFDYDSEYQDLYTKVATALVNDYIDIHQALIFQSEIKKGLHTAKSGQLLIRNYPGRLLVYPAQAAFIALIFFGGNWSDAGVAAITGLAAGLIEWGIDSAAPGDFKILKDVVVGISTGIIGCLFFRFDNEGYCLRSIFLGTLYWFFYGTAFVAGILEIIAGEIETGVTRFVAVSIKTFVLSMGASFGMAIVLVGDVSPFEAWVKQGENCKANGDFLDNDWLRLILYVASSIFVLGQYRFPVVNMWRSLLVQVAGYEVQFQTQMYLRTNGMNDNLDTAISNILGAMAAVVTSELLAAVVDNMLYCYNARILHRNKTTTKIGTFFFKITAFFVRASNFFGTGKESDLIVLDMKHKVQSQRLELHDDQHARSQLDITDDEKRHILDAIVNAEPINTWSILMPAVYQLVPGSQIANLWFSTIFPYDENLITDWSYLNSTWTGPPDEDLIADNYGITDSGEVFSLLMVISTSLALGLLLGFSLTNNVKQMLIYSFSKAGLDKHIGAGGDNSGREQELDNLKYRQGLMSLGMDDDPDDRDPNNVTDSTRSQVNVE